MRGTHHDTLRQSSITFGCVALLVSMIVLYLYFLNVSVVQVVMRTEYTQQQQDLHAEIATLESSYIQAQHEIATQVATLEGYDLDSPKIFISREHAGLALRNQ